MRKLPSDAVEKSNMAAFSIDVEAAINMNAKTWSAYCAYDPEFTPEEYVPVL